MKASGVAGTGTFGRIPICRSVKTTSLRPCHCAWVAMLSIGEIAVPTLESLALGIAAPELMPTNSPFPFNIGAPASP